MQRNSQMGLEPTYDHVENYPTLVPYDLRRTNSSYDYQTSLSKTL